MLPLYKPVAAVFRLDLARQLTEPPLLTPPNCTLSPIRAYQLELLLTAHTLARSPPTCSDDHILLTSLMLNQQGKASHGGAPDLRC
jgi:hypothetical protein